jgi:hypothetical protein
VGDQANKYFPWVMALLAESITAEVENYLRRNVDFDKCYIPLFVSRVIVLFSLLD